ncbi:MAG: zinc-ribbon domain-containing protein [Oscillochloris sp.]|nr:zinc-ribbon domain-containing protein [Oscillochloris sp.]
MRCPHCDNTIPDDSVFCIECGRSVQAYTDRTRTLEAEQQRQQLPQAPQLPVPASAPSQARYQRSHRFPRRNYRHLAGGAFLIGLGVLFLTGLFWPGILGLIGLVGALEELAKGKTRAAGMSLVFFGGMAFLFATDLFWPGILILLGILALIDRTK